jgi:urease alpha subunit
MGWSSSLKQSPTSKFDKNMLLAMIQHNNNKVIPNKLEYARNETHSESIEIRDLKYKKSTITMIENDKQAK